MATDSAPMHYQWEKQVEGEWQRVDSSVLPEWVKSKKSVRFAAAGGVLSKHGAGQPLERYRLVKRNGHATS